MIWSKGASVWYIILHHNLYYEDDKENSQKIKFAYRARWPLQLGVHIGAKTVFMALHSLQ